MLYVGAGLCLLLSSTVSAGLQALDALVERQRTGVCAGDPSTERGPHDIQLFYTVAGIPAPYSGPKPFYSEHYMMPQDTFTLSQWRLSGSRFKVCVVCVCVRVCACVCVCVCVCSLPKTL